MDEELNKMFDAIFASYKSRPTPYKAEDHAPVQTIKPRFNLVKDSTPVESVTEPDPNKKETK